MSKRTLRTNPITQRLVALGDPVRLRLIRLLESHELSVGELSSILQLPQSTVSRHLKLLADAAWVSRRSEGTATLYRFVLDDLAAPPRGLWLSVRSQLEDSTEFAQDRRRLAGVLAERREDTQQFFGRVAGEWDALRTHLFGNHFTTQALLSLLPSEWVVADLACGTANVAEILAPLVRRVIAVDQSAAMLAAAEKRLAEFTNVDLRKGDLESLPLKDASVDAAVCVLALHHVDDPPACLRQMRRVLRAQPLARRLLVVDMLPHTREEFRRSMGHRWLGFDEREFTGWLMQAGFTEIRFSALAASSESKGPGLFAACAAPAAGEHGG